MKRWVLLLFSAFLLSACAPTLTPIASPTGRGESAPPLAGGGWEGVTPAPTETPTPTPIPTYTIEQLKAMTPEQKLALAPQAADVPQDVLASYLPAGAEASSITWGEQTLTFWERVVAYHGQTADGQTVTMYFDLESGQWAKKYASFEEAAKIPAEEVPDVMVLTDAVMGDDRLIRAKLQYDYDWISQPQVMIDGKKVFRDEKGYPKAVFDTVSKKWLTPEEADVVWTWEKYMEAVTYTGDTKKNITINMMTNEYFTILTDPNVIMSMEDGSPFLILNPSGIITVGGDRNFVIARMKEGATIFASTLKNDMTTFSFIKEAVGIARNAFEDGHKVVRVEIGEFNEKLKYNQGSLLWIEDLVTVALADGTVVGPILIMPEHFTVIREHPISEFTLQEAGLSELTFINWLDKIIKSGFSGIGFYPQSTQ